MCRWCTCWRMMRWWMCRRISCMYNILQPCTAAWRYKYGQEDGGWERRKGHCTCNENRTKQVLNIETLSCRYPDVLFRPLILAHKKDRVCSIVWRRDAKKCPYDISHYNTKATCSRGNDSCTILFLHLSYRFCRDDVATWIAKINSTDIRKLYKL